MEQKNLTCIGCPLGCQITVKSENGKIVSVNGNTRKRGEDYARKEVTAPARIVTTTVKVSGGNTSVVSVKTKADLPKEKMFDCIRALKEVTVQAPVENGNVVLKNVLDTGVDIVATKKVEARNSCI